VHGRRALGEDEGGGEFAVLGLGTCEREGSCAGILQ